MTSASSLLRLSQTATEVGAASLIYALVTHKPSGPKQAPNPTYFCKWNVETSYRSPHCFYWGQQTAKSAHGGAGTGSRKKRMPFCNRTDRGCNITLRESGQTSSWSFFTGELVEPSLRRESK